MSHKSGKHSKLDQWLVDLRNGVQALTKTSSPIQFLRDVHLGAASNLTLPDASADCDGKMLMLVRDELQDSGTTENSGTATIAPYSTDQIVDAHISSLSFNNLSRTVNALAKQFGGVFSWQTTSKFPGMFNTSGHSVVLAGEIDGNTRRDDVEAREVDTTDWDFLDNLAPTDSEYITVSATSDLSAEHVLQSDGSLLVSSGTAGIELVRVGQNDFQRYWSVQPYPETTATTFDIVGMPSTSVSITGSSGMDSVSPDPDRLAFITGHIRSTNFTQLTRGWGPILTMKLKLSSENQGDRLWFGFTSALLTSPTSAHPGLVDLTGVNVIALAINQNSYVTNTTYSNELVLITNDGSAGNGTITPFTTPLPQEGDVVFRIKLDCSDPDQVVLSATYSGSTYTATSTTKLPSLTQLLGWTLQQEGTGISIGRMVCRYKH
jgi:hypothetical protein